ncbi:MAG: hypothetical protein NT167_04350 [Verrucomicrobia bacterium]|nr:hypothetical protein [Verrucomicrobiota bacterium]
MSAGRVMVLRVICGLGQRILSGMVILLVLQAAYHAGAAEIYARQGSWVETVLATRVALAAASVSNAEPIKAAEQAWFRLKEDFPMEWDWALQDGSADSAQWLRLAGSMNFERRMVEKVISELGDSGQPLRQKRDQLAKSVPHGTDRQWLELYISACEMRRQQRLKTLVAKAPKIIFTKHRTIRPSFFAYTEGQSDAQAERHFLPNSELCLLEMEGTHGKVRTLVSDPKGAIRDPAVSWDGQRVLFAWKKSLDEDDYHLYELNMASNLVRQITSRLFGER